MSVSDLSGRFDEPSTGRLHRPLSNSASTDCCSIRFSLRMMTSGALRSTSFLRRLLRLMMRREKAFWALVGEMARAGRESGGRAGGVDRGDSHPTPPRLFGGPPQAPAPTAPAAL